MIYVADRVLVRFAGEGTGSGPLSWGQQTIWRQFEARGAPVWLSGLQATRPDWAVEDAAAELAFIMSRNQSMRTRLAVSSDRPVWQTVCDSGEIHLQVIDAADQDDAWQVAKDLKKRWTEDELAYDYANDWPVRMALIRQHGKAAYKLLATSHIVTDAYGAFALFNDVRARDPVTGGPSGPIASMEPLEQAQWQAGPAGRRCSQMSERYWERLLRVIPAERFGQPARQPVGQVRSRYGRLSFQSRAAHLAVKAIAARTSMSTSAVLLTATAVGMTRATGVHPLVPRLQVSNRFRPRLAATVSPIAQSAPCVIDIAGASFDEAVRRAHRSSLVAYKHAYFEPARIRELVGAISDQRGTPIDLSLMYNDIRINTQRETASEPPLPREVQAALPLTTITWQDEYDPQMQCGIEFDNCPGTINALMVIDTHYLGRTQAEASLRELEAVLVAAAFDPDVPTR